MRRALPLLVVLTATGCWVPVEKGRRMESRIARLEVENEAARRREEEQRAVIQDRIGRVDKKLEELNQAARRSGADLSVQVQRLQEEVAKLRGVLEVDEHRLGEVEQSVQALRTETEGRMAALKGTGALDEFEAKRRIAELPRPDDADAVFALAQQEEATGDKGAARAIYDHFVKRWPKDPRAAEAGYRNGELLFSARRYREALLAYGRAAEDFPKAAVAPDALLGAAEAMVRLDMKPDAKGIFSEVVTRYPGSAAAKKAKARLSELFPAAKKPAAKKR